MQKVWLITGSSRGLGRHLAEAVLEAGDLLVATARQPAQLAELTGKYDERVRAVALDVTNAEAARAAVQAAVDAFGRLDVVVNNAGYGDIATIEDAQDAPFRAQIETNFFGVVNVTQAALPVLRAQGHGHIIQISSIGGRVGTPGLAAYQSAKWAVEGFSEVLALETAAFGIKVTLVEPGGFRTDWAKTSMTVHPVSDPYRPLLDGLLGLLEEPSVARGDPAKGAQAILKLAALEQPPLRLLLGGDAVYLAGHVAKRRAAEDERWKALSLSTDVDGLPSAESVLAPLLGEMG